MQVDGKSELGASVFGLSVAHGSFWDLHRRRAKDEECGASCRLDSQGNVRLSGAAPSYAQLQQSNGALPAAAMYHNMLQQNGSMQPARCVSAALLSAASTALLYLAVIEEDGTRTLSRFGSCPCRVPQDNRNLHPGYQGGKFDAVFLSPL